MSERRSSADRGPNRKPRRAAFHSRGAIGKQDAVAVEAKLSTSQLGGTDAALLAAPLPSEPGEPSAAPSATATPLAHSGVRSQSLAEMARRSVENKQAAEREMARASLALAAQQRPVVPPAPPSAASAPRPVAAAPNARERTATSEHGWPVAKVWRGCCCDCARGGRVVLAEATRNAGAASEHGRANCDSSEERSQAEQRRSAGRSPNAGASRATPLPSGIDPNSLPGENATKPADAAHEKPSAAAARTPTAGAASSGPNAEKIVLEDEPEKAPAATAAPIEKPVEKALPPDPALRPADSTGGAVPTKPSTGAVQAALGAVMSGARHCVAGEDAASSAVVVFSSDGRVQSVSVSGPAAGQSSGACIQAQLSRARVHSRLRRRVSVSAPRSDRIDAGIWAFPENRDLPEMIAERALTSPKASLIVPAPRALSGPFLKVF